MTLSAWKGRLYHLPMMFLLVLAVGVVGEEGISPDAMDGDSMWEAKIQAPSTLSTGDAAGIGASSAWGPLNDPITPLPSTWNKTEKVPLEGGAEVGIVSSQRGNSANETNNIDVLVSVNISGKPVQSGEAHVGIQEQQSDQNSTTGEGVAAQQGAVAAAFALPQLQAHGGGSLGVAGEEDWAQDGCAGMSEEAALVPGVVAHSQECAETCLAETCNGHGTCTGEACHCQCAAGFTGPFCEEKVTVVSNFRLKRPPKPCPDNCGGNGECMHNGTCLCVKGWAGYNCSLECAGGAKNACSGHGTCNVSDGKCLCDEGFAGRNCTRRSVPTDVNEYRANILGTKKEVDLKQLTAESAAPMLQDNLADSLSQPSDGESHLAEVASGTRQNGTNISSAALVPEPAPVDKFVKGVVIEEEKLSTYGVNHAAFDLGSKALASNKDAKGQTSLLRTDRDKYWISPCKLDKGVLWVIIELSEIIHVHTVVLGSFEYYSSTPKAFQVLGQLVYPTDEWQVLGLFAALPTRQYQEFKLRTPVMSKYLKFRFLSHHGTEFYCTLSSIRVFGRTQWEEMGRMLDANEEVVEEAKRRLDGKAQPAMNSTKDDNIVQEVSKVSTEEGRSSIESSNDPAIEQHKCAAQRAGEGLKSDGGGETVGGFFAKLANFVSMPVAHLPAASSLRSESDANQNAIPKAGNVEEGSSGSHVTAGSSIAMTTKVIAFTTPMVIAAEMRASEVGESPQPQVESYAAERSLALDSQTPDTNATYTDNVPGSGELDLLAGEGSDSPVAAPHAIAACVSVNVSNASNSPRNESLPDCQAVVLVLDDQQQHLLRTAAGQGPEKELNTEAGVERVAGSRTIREKQEKLQEAWQPGGMVVSSHVVKEEIFPVISDAAASILQGAVLGLHALTHPEQAIEGGFPLAAADGTTTGSALVAEVQPGATSERSDADVGNAQVGSGWEEEKHHVTRVNDTDVARKARDVEGQEGGAEERQGHLHEDHDHVHDENTWIQAHDTTLGLVSCSTRTDDALPVGRGAVQGKDAEWSDTSQVIDTDQAIGADAALPVSGDASLSHASTSSSSSSSKPTAEPAYSSSRGHTGATDGMTSAEDGGFFAGTGMGHKQAQVAGDLINDFMANFGDAKSRALAMHANGQVSGDNARRNQGVRSEQEQQEEGKEENESSNVWALHSAPSPPWSAQSYSSSSDASDDVLGTSEVQDLSTLEVCVQSLRDQESQVLVMTENVADESGTSASRGQRPEHLEDLRDSTLSTGVAPHSAAEGLPMKGNAEGDASGDQFIVIGGGEDVKRKEVEERLAIEVDEARRKEEEESIKKKEGDAAKFKKAIAMVSTPKGEMSFFQKVPAKIKDLEINQSLLQSYIQDIKRHYDETFEDVQSEAKSVQDELGTLHDKLKASVASLTEKLVALDEFTKAMELAHKEQMAHIKSETDQLLSSVASQGKARWRFYIESFVVLLTWLLVGRHCMPRIMRFLVWLDLGLSSTSRRLRIHSRRFPVNSRSSRLLLLVSRCLEPPNGTAEKQLLRGIMKRTPSVDSLQVPDSQKRRGTETAVRALEKHPNRAFLEQGLGGSEHNLVLPHRVASSSVTQHSPSWKTESNLLRGSKSAPKRLKHSKSSSHASALDDKSRQILAGRTSSSEAAMMSACDRPVRLILATDDFDHYSGGSSTAHESPAEMSASSPDVLLRQPMSANSVNSRVVGFGRRGSREDFDDAEVWSSKEFGRAKSSPHEQKLDAFEEVGCRFFGSKGTDRVAIEVRSSIQGLGLEEGAGRVGQGDFKPVKKALFGNGKRSTSLQDVSKWAGTARTHPAPWIGKSSTAGGRYGLLAFTEENLSETEGTESPLRTHMSCTLPHKRGADSLTSLHL